MLFSPSMRLAILETTQNYSSEFLQDSLSAFVLLSTAYELRGRPSRPTPTLQPTQFRAWVLDPKAA